MATIILRALDPYLVPPLAHMVLEYLTVTYTLELRDWNGHRSKLGNDIEVRCEVTPFRNHLIGTYITKLVNIPKDQLDKLRGRGWTFRSSKRLDGQLDRRFASQSFEGSPEALETFTKAVAQDPTYFKIYGWRVQIVLTDSAGLLKEDSTEGRVRNCNDLIKCLKRFVEEVMTSRGDIDVPKVWFLIENLLK